MKILACLCFALFIPLNLMAQDAAALRKERDKLAGRGLWRDALNLYEEKLMPISDRESGFDLSWAIDAIHQHGDLKKFDALVEQAVAMHPENTCLLHQAALAYDRIPHTGQMIAGEFTRNGSYYGNSNADPDEVPEASAGSKVNTTYRDHVRSLQLLYQSVKVQGGKPSFGLGSPWGELAERLKDVEPWKLQTITPIDKLPEWGEPGPDGATEGAPWSKDGPVLYEIPNSWEAAKNDGERWLFAREQQVKVWNESGSDPSGSIVEHIRERALFLNDQFGVETLSSYGWWRQQDPESAKGILEVDTLAEDECLTKTSDGVRRFKLPANQHFIALYRSILDQSSEAGDELTQIFLNRRQYDKARAVLEQTIAKHGPGNDDIRKLLLKQITGNWGRFESADTVAAGTKPKLPLVFRNATAISLTASPVNMDKVINDTIAYIKSNPRELDDERVDLSEIANRLIKEKQSKYIGKTAATWETKLSPLDKHADTHANLEVPLEKAGAWWISGKMTGGNEFFTLVWIVDSVLIQRDVAGKLQWWVADAESGAPVAKADIQYFGYRTIDLDRRLPFGRDTTTKWKEFSRTTDADGKTLLKPGDWDEKYEWLAIARSEGRSPAFYGFQSYYADDSQRENGNRDLSYGISDRPLYKAGDTVHLKFFLRSVGYFEPNDARWANQTGTLTLYNGRGEETLKIEKLKTDALGAIETETIIPKNAPLGTWRATYQPTTENGHHPKNRITSQLSFQVEEYRKPEYEVKVEAPDEPVKLGDQFTATIKANYFHGAPVRNANVEIIVKRSSLGEKWFPAWRWDWLYGAGAWWNGTAASWHPSWKSWGCIPPHPSWWGGNRRTPDELILKRNVPISEDGTAKIEINTAPAKAIHGDMDATYTIEARVVDASRREERGTGSVIAARKPFEVVIWTDRGYAKAGDEVEASVSTATLTGKPVAGAKGTLKLFHLTMAANGRVGEAELKSWPIETDADGNLKQKFAAPVTGQYRLAASLSFKDGEAVEGATILNVHGLGRDDPDAWRFGPLELVCDKTEYKPGESVKLRINSDRANANVWLFLHIADSSGTEAKRIQLNGKSLEMDVPLTLKDMPNMFIEGITVHGAEIHSTVKQILLPPVSKMIEVTLEPAKTRVKPQEKSSLRVTLRDAEGKPVKGTAILTVYDKSLEAITGGSNVGPIHENFWKWINNFQGGSNENSLPDSPGNLTRPKATSMESLGRIGYGFGYGKWKGFGMGGGAGSDYYRAAYDTTRSQLLMEVDAAWSAKSAPMIAGVPEASNIVTAGNRSGDYAISRNSIDAILNNPNRAGGPNLDPGAAANPILVRKDFADLLKWSGSIETDADGHAEIPLEFPDNLTTWKARVWTLGKGTTVGEGSTEIITSKELLVRLQAPRFLVERDEAVLSAVVHNDHDSPKTVKVSFELDGKELEAINGTAKTVEIAARSEARVDWQVKALHEGSATLRMRADAGDDGDAVEQKLPILVHGMSRQDAWSRAVEPEQNSASIQIEVPEQRRPDQSKLTVRFSPTIAGAVLDAIPYLADYPHGCTEQTLNRFVPAVIAQRMLKDLKINLDEIKAKRTNLNPQELGNAEDRAAQWKQWQHNPVFDEAEIEKMTAAGVDKLMSMQNSDGGWGWFSGHGEYSYPHTTAVVVHGLLIAKSNGAKIPDITLTSGIAWLMIYEKKQTKALQLYVEREALRKAGKKVKDDNRYEKSQCDATDAFIRMILGEAKRDSEPMLAFLYRDRVDLPVYAKCLLGLEEHRKGDKARRDEVMNIISQFLKRDEENQTAYLDLKNQGYWWNWYGGEIEAHAWYLKLLAAVKPKDADTRGLVKYLVNNRKNATYWESTRDTAYAIEAIAAYFKASGENAPEMDVEVLLDGKSLKKISINRDNLFTFDGTFMLTGDEVTTGKHTVELRKTGKGTLYANAYLEVFTLEDKLRAAGLEVKIQRKISKLIELEKETEVPDATGLIVKQRVERFRREPLEEGASLKSGDRIEVELILDSKNDYEYLLFSDAKAAGFEALDALSGYISGNDGFSTYMEPRDQTVDFFIRALPRGTHTLRYQLRAEAPGFYKALPAKASAMYAPELRGNSDDIRLKIE